MEDAAKFVATAIVTALCVVGVIVILKVMGFRFP